MVDLNILISAEAAEMGSSVRELLQDFYHQHFGDAVELFQKELKSERPGKVWDTLWILKHPTVVERFAQRWLHVLQECGFLWDPDADVAKNMTDFQRVVVSQLYNVPGAELFFGKNHVTYYGPDQEGARVVMHIAFGGVHNVSQLAKPETLVLDVLESWRSNPDRVRAHKARRELCEAILAAMGVTADELADAAA